MRLNPSEVAVVFPRSPFPVFGTVAEHLHVLGTGLGSTMKGEPVIALWLKDLMFSHRQY